MINENNKNINKIVCTGWVTYYFNNCFHFVKKNCKILSMS